MSTPTTDGFPEMSRHPDEPHNDSVTARLNALRAGVLGANDGIVSVAALVMGLAGATNDRHTIFVAGLAGLDGHGRAPLRWAKPREGLTCEHTVGSGYPRRWPSRASFSGCHPL